MVTLEELGWSSFFEAGWQEVASRDARCKEIKPARVVGDGRGVYRLRDAAGEQLGEVAGRLRYEARSRAELPAVGDWVAARAGADGGRAMIHAVLRRRSQVTRKTAGRTTSEQVLAANVDTLFLVSSLAGDLNLRRLERYVALAHESGARPVVLLTKADVCEDLPARVSAAEGGARGVPVLAVSSVTGEGIAELGAHLGRGRTAAFLGPSGVGKSTLINLLLGREAMAVREVRESDGRGRHATSARFLFLLPESAPAAGMVIDTPGLRELQLWEASGALEATFADIEWMAEECRFRDCRHESEPGCAVRAAVEAGELEAGRLGNFHKLRREMDYLERRKNAALEAEHEKKWRGIHKEMRRFDKGRRWKT